MLYSIQLTSPVIQNEIFLRVTEEVLAPNKQEIRNIFKSRKSTRLLNNISQMKIDLLLKRGRRDQYIAFKIFFFLSFRKMKNLLVGIWERLKTGNYKFNVDVLFDLTMKYINKISRFSDRLLYFYFCGI